MVFTLKALSGVCIRSPPDRPVVEISDASCDIGHIDSHITELSAQNQSPRFLPGAIGPNLKKLIVNKHVENSSIPDTVEHLVIQTPSEHPFPFAKNIYLHARSFDDHSIPVEHYAFYWGYTIPESKLGKDKYNLIGQPFEIKIAGKTIWAIKRVPKKPEPEPEIDARPTELVESVSDQDLISLKKKSLDVKIAYLTAKRARLDK